MEHVFPVFLRFL